MYISTKRYDHDRGYSIAYRQWKADSHCKYIHGYSLAFDFEFEAEELDVRNWVCDFGGFKTLKAFLDEYFDHTLLVSMDDPDLEFFREIDRRGLAQVREVVKTGCEGLSEFLYWFVNAVWLPENGYGDRVHCSRVRVHETPSNSAMVVGNRDDWPALRSRIEEEYDGH